MNIFLNNANSLIARWSTLKEWVSRYPLKALQMNDSCDRILRVLDWFAAHPARYLYLRQLDIEGVDTKFIETNKALISELLNIILPESEINLDGKNFEERYGLKSKPKLVRFRVLDGTVCGFTDMTVPLAEFAQWQAPYDRFFFIENEINFLSFPYVPNACAIFTGGYAVEQIKEVPWLKEKSIFYWGDIDTHGFNILSIARSFLPQIESFMMTEEILLAHQSLWVSEDKPFLSSIKCLTGDELALVQRLQDNHWGKGVRLEQERIKFSYFDAFAASFV